MSTFTAVDLSRLPAPSVVEPLSFEAILASMRADLLSLAPELADVLAVESEPINKLMQVCAYRELNSRQRANDQSRQNLLAFASGTTLDHRAAEFGLARFVLDPGDPTAIPPLAPTMESDTDLRRRIQLAPEAFTTAGSEGSYIFHALNAHADVLDASVESPAPGQVIVNILSRSGDGTASAGLLLAVSQKLSSATVRPLNDLVTVQSAAIVPYAVEAVLWTFAGPDSTVVLAEANARLSALLAESHRLARDVARSAIFAALHSAGVQRVDLIAPPADIVISAHQAAYATSVDITHGGIGE